MSTIKESYAVAVRPIADRFFALTERVDSLQAELDSRIVEQAESAITEAVTDRTS